MSKTMNEFKKLGLSEETLVVLEAKGYTEPTPIQKLTIPLLLKGDLDVIGKAQTGTGKTACFALPIIERIHKTDDHVQALILTPTRELALQVSKEIDSLQGDRHFRILTVYGGSSIRDQMIRLKQGVHIVVGTPGRVMDLINRQKLKLNHIAYAVLDEADEMLNMGFVEDIKEILSHTNKNKKMLLFSATMPKEILKIAKQFMGEYKVVEVKDKEVTPNLTTQIYYDLRPKDRIEALHRIIDTTPDFHGIVFCRTRVMVDEVASKLRNAKYSAAPLHGEISQGQREKTLGLFRRKIVNILVATDVAARGIDIIELTHVINFSLPQNSEGYIHRIGRTGRAGKQGTAITFIIPSEKRRLKFIERVVRQKLIKGTLPSIKEVVEIKKKGLKTKISKILQDPNTRKFADISKALLAENPSEKVVSALLKYIFASEIEVSKYHEVQRVTEDREFRGRSKGRPDRRQDRSGRFKGRYDGKSKGRSHSKSERYGGKSKGHQTGRSKGRPEGRPKDKTSKSKDFSSYSTDKKKYRSKGRKR